MALDVKSVKKKPQAPRKNPEGGLLDGDLVRDAGPAVGVGFALAHLETQVEGFEWFRKMSNAKRLLALVVAAVYFRRKGNHALAYGLFALAGTYVPKYLAEKKAKEAAGNLPAGAAPAGNTMVSPPVKDTRNTMVHNEMTEVVGAIPYRPTAYSTFAEEPELPFNTNNLFAVG